MSFFLVREWQPKTKTHRSLPAAAFSQTADRKEETGRRKQEAGRKGSKTHVVGLLLLHKLIILCEQKNIYRYLYFYIYIWIHIYIYIYLGEEEANAVTIS